MGDSGNQRVGALVAAAAIVMAPFIAFLYRAEAGLLVMASALGATSLLLHQALDAVPPRGRNWLHLVLVANVLLIVACVALAVGLFVRR